LNWWLADAELVSLLGSGVRLGRLGKLFSSLEQGKAWFLGWINKTTKQTQAKGKDLGMGRDISSHFEHSFCTSTSRSRSWARKPDSAE